MGLVKLALKNAHAVAVLGLVILLLGVTVAARIPADLLPVFKTPAVQILTFYPGMPAEIMEKDISTRLERWTGQANGIARQESKSMMGVSIVKDYFRPDIDPNTAMSQVTSLAMSDLYYLPPGTIPPMVMPFDPTASIPLCVLSVSSPQYDETRLYDIAYFDLRNRLQGITGVIAPAVYGGRLRRILAYVDRDKLMARNLSPLDVAQAIRRFNVMVPTGNAKLGDFDYQINARGMVETVPEIDAIPIRFEGGAPVYVGDVARTEDSSQIQTNIVRIDGRRQVYIPIYRQPGANTIAVVDGVKRSIEGILKRLPAGVNLDVILDQSVFVRKAIRDLLVEGASGAVLAALMILVFLASVRPTGIVLVSLPLALLAAVLVLYAAGQTLNAMTLGGMALAVGLLIDQSIVVLENIDRHLGMGKAAMAAALDGATEVARPVVVISLTVVVVFFPVTLLAGIGRFLFAPLALSVTAAIGASLLLALTLVPALAGRLLVAAPETHGDEAGRRSRGLLAGFGRAFEVVRGHYGRMLAAVVRRPLRTTAAAVALFAAALAVAPRLGRELFPVVDSDQFTIRVRAATGLRVEATEKRLAAVEATIREVVPRDELRMVLTNIGVLLDWPAAYTPNSGPQDAFVSVQLHGRAGRGWRHYVPLLRERLREEHPDLEVAFDTGGLLTAALNFGLPSPINVQIEGNDLEIAHGIAEEIRDAVARVPGAVDVRIQQRLDAPQVVVDVDRVKAGALGLTHDDVVRNIVTAFNSSVNFAPSFWIDERNGNHYFIGAQYREAAMESFKTIEDIPVTPAGGGPPRLLRNIARLERTTAPSEVNHLNITRVFDVFANVEGRDIGSVAGEVERGLAAITLPPGYSLHVRGEVKSMRESFGSLGFGLVLAAALVYLVLVLQFRSFLDPLLVLAAVPLGGIGVVLALLVTSTALSIQSLMGVIMMIGIVVSYSVLLVDFANRERRGGASAAAAVVAAGSTRLRPILMTSLATILGLLPMAVAGGVNVPLARAVIGGVAVAALLSLLVVPALYVLAHRNAGEEATR